MDLLSNGEPAGTYPHSVYAAQNVTGPPLMAAKGAISADVCVIGGGYTGLSAALHLAQRGYRVTLLEAQRVGFGASGRNGGQVGAGQRLDQTKLEKLVGRPAARHLFSLAIEAVDTVKSLAAAPQIDCPFHAGVLHPTHKASLQQDEWAYAEMLQQDYGYAHISTLTKAEMRDLVRSRAYYGGTLDTASGHLDPLRFALGLARLARAQGATIYENSRVISVTDGPRPCIKTDSAVVTADHVILACNGYLGDLNKHVAARVMPINNFIVATAPMSVSEQSQIIKNNYAVADSKFVINYFRFSDDHRLLFGGTESYGYRFPRDIARMVRKPMVRLFPQLADVQIDYAWGGSLGITMNRMPHFERLSGQVLSMSGSSGHGIAMATLAGKLAAEAIAGQAERFDILANVPTPKFPGGARWRNALLVLGMVWYSLRDRL